MIIKFLILIIYYSSYNITIIYLLKIIMKSHYVVIIAIILFCLVPLKAKIQERHLQSTSQSTADQETSAFIKAINDLSADSKGNSYITNNISKNCVKKFRPFLETFPPNVMTKIVDHFNNPINNTSKDTCCHVPSISTSILEVVHQNIDKFTFLMTDQSSQSKA